jgi:hypothetical protein
VVLNKYIIYLSDQILHLFVLDEVNVFVVPVSVIFGVGTVKRNTVVNGVSVTITIVLFTMVLSVEVRNLIIVICE